MISGLTSSNVDQYDFSTIRYLSQVNNLFTTRAKQNFDDGFPLDIVTVQQEQQK